MAQALKPLSVVQGKPEVHCRGEPAFESYSSDAKGYHTGQFILCEVYRWKRESYLVN